MNIYYIDKKYNISIDSILEECDKSHGNKNFVNHFVLGIEFNYCKYST